MDPTQAVTIADEIESLFSEQGSQWYGGESVSQLQHALQSATFAERDGANAEMIVAALLHDVGHLLHDLPEDAAEQGVDDHHEKRAIGWLARRFPRSVVEPVGLHVDAKRYLCTIDEEYAGLLSPASQTSLKIQGGPMNAEEQQKFESNDYYKEAVQLRRWDDEAKIVDYETPGLDHFRTSIVKAAEALGSEA